MTKDIPEIDDLTKGINDPDISLTDEPQDQSGAQESSAQEISLKVENLVPFMNPPIQEMAGTTVWYAS